MERHILRSAVLATSILLTWLVGIAAHPMAAAAHASQEQRTVLTPEREEADRELQERLQSEPDLDGQIGIVGREYVHALPDSTDTFFLRFVAWAFSDTANAQAVASALITNLGDGRILAGATEVDGPAYANESAFFVGTSDDDGEEYNIAYLVVRDGVTVALWAAAGFGDDQTATLIEEADTRWGDGVAASAFEPGSDPEAAMLDLLPGGDDLPDGFRLEAEAAVLMIEPDRSRLDWIRDREHGALAIV